MMYTDKELQALKAQLKKRRILMLTVAGVLAAGVIVMAILRQELWTTVLTIFCGFWLIFFSGMALKPVKDMIAHVDGLLNGKTHELICSFDRVDDEVSLVDGVHCHAVYTVEDREGEPEPIERLFYFDINKPFPQLGKGDQVKVIYHDRMLGLIEPA